MKIVSRFVAIFAFAALCLGLSLANAQDVQTMTVKFPYPITVGSKTLPARNYTISPFDSSSDAPIFVVRGAEGNAIALSTARVSAARHQLTKDDGVIEVSGNKHMLSQVRLQYSDSVFNLVRSNQ